MSLWANTPLTLGLEPKRKSTKGLRPFVFYCPQELFTISRRQAEAIGEEYGYYERRALVIPLCLESLGVASGEPFRVNGEDYTPPPSEISDYKIAFRRHIVLPTNFYNRVTASSGAGAEAKTLYAVRGLHLLNSLVEFGIGDIQVITLETPDSGLTLLPENY